MSTALEVQACSETMLSCEACHLLQAFVNRVSGHEGAEVPATAEPHIGFSDRTFWHELKSALGTSADPHADETDASDSELSSSDFSDDETTSSSGSSISASSISGTTSQRDHGLPRHMQLAEMGSSSSKQHRATQHGFVDPQQPLSGAQDNSAPLKGSSGAAVQDSSNGDDSDVMTATDSDDEDASFMQTYDQALVEELYNSRVDSILKHSNPAQTYSDQNDKAQSKQLRKKDEDELLKPVELDTNLVRNLLQSYSAQQGLAGPAGNLAGLLGLRLPENTE